MKKRTLILLVLVSAIIINSCRRDKYIPNICFKENILPIFISKCGSPGCHSTASKSGGYDLTNYEGILKGVTPYHLNKSEIYENIKGSNPKMPVAGSPQLTAKEIENIKYWINFGAVNSSCGTSTASVSNCDTSATLTYDNSIKGIIDPNCLGCHPNFNTYANVSANASNILTRIKLPEANSLHMPQGFSLSTCNVAKIEKWITLGKPQ